MYTSPGCASCRKAKQWLKDHNLDFVEKNIFKVMLNETELRYLLRRSENGTEDIISTRSKVIKESNINLDEMRISELITFIQNNPSILKRPIILSEKSMQVGYNSDDLEIFLPRLKEQAKCEHNCPKYSICGAIREDE